MGITGLIPFLEKASSKVHLKDLSGCTVAVDTYCWLHKGVFSCAEKLVRGEETDLYIQYCLRYVQLLLSFNIKPILVFDGRHLPAKALTEKRRRDSRQQSKKRAAELLRLGRTDEARTHMRRCVDVTHEMALRLIRECRQRNVDCVVAPYEADAQMAWLNKVELAQYVITEDSDLTLFGAKKVIFKLDLTGAGLLVEAEKLYLAMGCKAEKYTFDKFRRMCILSGCDYLDSLPGIGLAKACKFILKTEEDDMWRALKKIPQYLNMKHLEVDDEYIVNFLNAEATFKHMYIYNPLKRCMERLNELSEFQTDVRFCCNAGELLADSEQAFQLALGNLNPFTLQKLDNWHPDNFIQITQVQNKNIKRAKHKSIWERRSALENIDVKRQGLTNTNTSCALYFKKIDFISKTIDAEKNANQIAENAKLTEDVVFSMYKNEMTELRSPQPKRRRKNSSCSSNNSTPTKSPLTIKSRHNPFAKTNTAEDDVDSIGQPKSPVCRNGSLLRVLSPRKSKETLMKQTTHLSKLKRAIFANETTENVNIEIKSRFFEANIKEAQRSTTTTTPTTTATTALLTKSPDRQLQKQKECMALLYGCDSPSPPKKQKCYAKTIESTASSGTDSGIESICIENTMNNTEIQENIENTTNADTQTNEQKTVSILISDEDSIDKEPLTTSANTQTTTQKTTQFSAFKAQPLRRMGVFRTKTSGKSGTKLTKTNSANATSPPSSQTRLSMFGFQKRASLK